jgi:Tetratricopeptide repeat
MYHRALVGREKVLGPDHTSTISSILCLKISTKIRASWGRPKGCTDEHSKGLSLDHTSTSHSLWNLYNRQDKLKDKLKEAQDMYHRVLGPDHSSFEFSILYFNQR